MYHILWASLSWAHSPSEWLSDSVIAWIQLRRSSCSSRTLWGRLPIASPNTQGASGPSRGPSNTNQSRKRLIIWTSYWYDHIRSNAKPKASIQAHNVLSPCHAGSLLGNRDRKAAVLSCSYLNLPVLVYHPSIREISIDSSYFSVNGKFPNIKACELEPCVSCSTISMDFFNGSVFVPDCNPLLTIREFYQPSSRQSWFNRFGVFVEYGLHLYIYYA